MFWAWAFQPFVTAVVNDLLGGTWQDFSKGGRELRDVGPSSEDQVLLGISLVPKFCDDQCLKCQRLCKETILCPKSRLW